MAPSASNKSTIVPSPAFLPLGHLSVIESELQFSVLCSSTFLVSRLWSASKHYMFLLTSFFMRKAPKKITEQTVHSVSLVSPTRSDILILSSSSFISSIVIGIYLLPPCNSLFLWLTSMLALRIACLTSPLCTFSAGSPFMM